MHNKKALTIVELIVTITIVAIVLPLITSSLFITIRNQITASKLTGLKTAGDDFMSATVSDLQSKITDVYANSPGTNACAVGTPTDIIAHSPPTAIYNLHDSATDTYHMLMKWNREIRRYTCVGAFCPGPGSPSTSLQKYFDMSTSAYEVESFSILCSRPSASSKNIYTVRLTLRTRDYANVVNKTARARLDFMSTVVARK